MSQDQYFQIVITNVTNQNEDSVSSLCFEHGALGVSEDLPFTQKREDYEPVLLPVEFRTLVAYFKDRPSPELIQRLQQLDSQMKIQPSFKPQKDWLSEWKKGFHAFELCQGYWVVPSWEEIPDGQNAEKCLRIDPGMAFGTGTHATTQLASRSLQKVFSELDLEIKTVFDVGCGSGILSLLCEKLGAEKIVGVEIVESAREVARLNCQINASQNIQIVDNSVENVESTFDLVVANIIDGVLLQIQDSLIRSCRPGGWLVVTGIFNENEEGFVERFKPLVEAWPLVERTNQGDWVGYVLRRPQNA